MYKIYFRGQRYCFALFGLAWLLPLLDGTVIVADVPPVLDHGDDERSGQQYRQDRRVLVPALFRVLLLLERADAEVRLDLVPAGGRGGEGRGGKPRKAAEKK